MLRARGLSYDDDGPTMLLRQGHGCCSASRSNEKEGPTMLLLQHLGATVAVSRPPGSSINGPPLR
jgi:hypothetical protein